MPKGVVAACGDKIPKGEKSRREPTKLLVLIALTFSGLPSDESSKSPRGNRPKARSSLLPCVEAGGVPISFKANGPDPILDIGLGFIGGGGIAPWPFVEGAAEVSIKTLLSVVSELKLSMPMPDIVNWFGACKAGDADEKHESESSMEVVENPVPLEGACC